MFPYFEIVKTLKPSHLPLPIHPVAQFGQGFKHIQYVLQLLMIFSIEPHLTYERLHHSANTETPCFFLVAIFTTIVSPSWYSWHIFIFIPVICYPTTFMTSPVYFRRSVVVTVVRISVLRCFCYLSETHIYIAFLVLSLIALLWPGPWFRLSLSMFCLSFLSLSYVSLDYYLKHLPSLIHQT